MTRTDTAEVGRWLDGLLVTSRPDGRLLVRAAACASEHESGSAAELVRTREWVDARADETPAPPGLVAEVRAGRLSIGEASRIVATVRRVRARRRDEVAALVGRIAAVRERYPASGTADEALARAWWDGAFDDADDAEPSIPERGLSAAVAAVRGVAARLGGDDAGAAQRLLRARLDSTGDGPEWRALKAALVRTAIRDLMDDDGPPDGSPPDRTHPGRPSPPTEESG